MKKQKPPERSLPSFSNNPFKALKSIKQKAAPAPGPAKPAPAPAHKQRERQEDAEALFLRSVSGARPLDPEAAKKQTPERRQPRPDRSDGPDEQELFLHAMQKIGANFREPKPEQDPDERRRSSSSRMKQLKRGTIEIRGELDLHGYLREEALAGLEQFISQAYHRGQKAVLIITGKGINSPEGPVLQGAVSDWLQRKGKGMVAEFGPAPRDKGGSGAFVVFLKSR